MIRSPLSPDDFLLRNAPRLSSSLLAALASLAALGCENPDVFTPLPQVNGPAGVIEGTVTYSGPRPCTQGGHVVGAAVLLAFDDRLLPPPDGFGTSPTSLDVIAGDDLFAGVRAQLPDDPSGALRCPDAGAPSITVSASWTIAPLPAAVYQLRGFYDLDGDFDPAFIISNGATKGDVAGGAISNVADVLVGAAPAYTEITLGVPGDDGELEIPETGARVRGVAANFVRPLPLERPLFYPVEVLDEHGTNTDPRDVVMASDFQLHTFSAAQPEATEASFIRFRLAAGVPPDEVEAAAQSPFLFPVGGAEPPTITYARRDVNGDGILDAQDHVPVSAALPELYPLSTFPKLSEDSDLVTPSHPMVLIQGLTLFKSFAATAEVLNTPALSDPVQPAALVALQPSALCLDPTDTTAGGVLVVSHELDSLSNPVITDQPGLEAALSARFGRPITVQYGCLPEGRYAMNLTYSTSQAWTVPNEAGVCAPSETPGNGTCGSRAWLASQAPVLTVGSPNDPQYCKDHPTPTMCLL